MHVVPNSIPDVEGFVTSLVRNVPGAVYRCDVDADFTMQLIGDEVERISGYPVDDFIGNARRSFDSIIHEDDREGVHRDVARSASITMSRGRAEALRLEQEQPRQPHRFELGLWPARCGRRSVRNRHCARSRKCGG